MQSAWHCTYCRGHTETILYEDDPALAVQSSVTNNIVLYFTNNFFIIKLGGTVQYSYLLVSRQFWQHVKGADVLYRICTTYVSGLTVTTEYMSFMIRESVTSTLKTNFT